MTVGALCFAVWLSSFGRQLGRSFAQIFADDVVDAMDAHFVIKELGCVLDRLVKRHIISHAVFEAIGRRRRLRDAQSIGRFQNLGHREDSREQRPRRERMTRQFLLMQMIAQTHRNLQNAQAVTSPSDASRPYHRRIDRSGDDIWQCCLLIIQHQNDTRLGNT